MIARAEHATAGRISTPMLLLLGCVGRPIVGDLPPPDVEDESCPSVAFDCARFDVALTETPPDRDAFEPAPTSGCAPAVIGVDCGPLLFGESAIGGGVARGCRTTTPIVVTSSMTLSDVDLSCADLSIELVDDTTLTIDGSRVSGTQLRVHGGIASSIILERAEGELLHVALSGRAWMDMRNSTLRDLRVVAAPEVEGPALRITDSAVDGLAIRTGPRGSVDVERSRIASVVVDTGELITEETAADGIFAVVDRMLLAGSHVDRGAFHVRDGVFIGGAVYGVEVHECDRVRWVNAMINASRVSACREPTQLYDSQVVDSAFAGSISIERGKVTNSGFAPGPEETFEITGAEMLGSAFCGARRVLATGSSLECVSCRPEIETVELSGTKVIAPECPSLEAAALSHTSATPP